MHADKQAKQFDRDLLPGMRAIERIVDELDRERMRREVEIFAVALARDLVTASDFTPNRRR